MDTNQQDGTYSPGETDERREAILKRVLAMPPQPRKPIGKRKRVESQSK